MTREPMQVDLDDTIKRYLQALDAQVAPDAALLFRLGEMYFHKKEWTLATFFMWMAAPRHAIARDRIRGFFSHSEQIGIPDAPPQSPGCHPPDAGPRTGTICTAANAPYFHAALNLIGSCQGHSWDSIRKIVVCDLGLLPHQAAYLATLDRVSVIRSTWPFAFQQWKIPFICHILNTEPGSILYLDAGCHVERDLADIFSIIDQDGSFILFNIPHESPAHRTRAWTSSVVYEYFGIKKEEDDTTTVITTLLGFSGKGRALVEEAFEHNHEALLRPHADCPSNRYDQSLFSVFVQKVKGLEPRRGEPFIANLAKEGSPSPYIAVHKSKFGPGSSFGHLRRSNRPPSQG